MTMSNVSGIDFAALQVHDVDASAAFYTDVVGLERAPGGPPHAVVFATEPIPFAVREPSIDLDATDKLGWGVAMWFHAEDVDAVHARVTGAQRPILAEPFDGPFGRTFSFADPDGYAITVHGEA
jgi:predicted enzyme related to lactoylglutathione lyase